MSTRFKGLYQKSFKCFSDDFDGKDDEMEIGYPTNVRHVSHIGWDSSPNSAPSWVRNFYFPATIEIYVYNFFLKQYFKLAMEAFGEVESSKELEKESTKQNLKKKLCPKASLLCDPWSPRFSRSCKVLA
ncbi:hypothetical protein Bca52824_069335 [Brassica carinata]|uniref:CRIB domain-containing protein n=1 Tax=Brassica carinata TaxID=52824 RepID=A0A8X7Q252_BRACI|nr:hypothetical protein Bca52824_069335 [Brassica carinata]